MLVHLIKFNENRDQVNRRSTVFSVCLRRFGWIVAMIHINGLIAKQNNNDM